jgi:hypothetical protein
LLIIYYCSYSFEWTTFKLLVVALGTLVPLVELMPEAEFLEELRFLEMAAFCAERALWLTALLLDLWEAKLVLLLKSLLRLCE